MQLELNPSSQIQEGPSSNMIQCEFWLHSISLQEGKIGRHSTKTWVPKTSLVQFHGAYYAGGPKTLI